MLQNGFDGKCGLNEFGFGNFNIQGRFINLWVKNGRNVQLFARSDLLTVIDLE